MPNTHLMLYRAAVRRALAPTLLLLLLLSTPALAATVTDRPLLFSFDGHDTSAGNLVKPNKIAIDNSTGDLYVSEGPAGSSQHRWTLNEAVSKFSPDGTAADFSATGGSSLFGTPAGPFGSDVSVAVDDSGGANQGRLYVLEGAHHVLDAFDEDGTFLWQIADIDIAQVERSDVAVDHEGHPWILGDRKVREYASGGSPPAEISSCELSGSERERFGLDFDANGNLYVAGFEGVDKYTGCLLDGTVDSFASHDVFADQSEAAGHLFASRRESGDFNEYDSSGGLVGTYGAGAIAAPHGIAYSNPLDRVYVANEGLDIVEAFGTAETGTVPDPTIEATAAEGPGTVTFHGSINPQGVGSAYYFEWVEASETGNSFAHEDKRFFRSPEFTNLPADSVPHAVQYKATNVRGNAEWKVRLVVANSPSGDGLRAVSGQGTFEPPKATEAPAATIDPVEKEAVAPCTSGITRTEACISGTVNPKNDSSEVAFEWLAGGECAASWGTIGNSPEIATLYVPGGEVNSPTLVEHNLKGLKAGEHYCVRLTARNSFGSSGPTAIEQFDTLPNPPDEVTTAFAAPRTDTTARINGRLDPEGRAKFEYQFEWSEDGTTWQQLPLREESVDVREPIVVSDELTGLKPETRYYYRLSTARNETGPAAEVGTVKSFVTRSTSEMVLPPNAFGEPDKPGIELVNSPDKGNQNVFFETISTGIPAEVPFISPDGEETRWGVSAGSPGSPNGLGSQFLAKRLPEPTQAAPNGWESTSLAPPATEQPGEGSLVYNVTAATLDQQRFVADLRPAGLSKVPESTIVRLDTHRHEEVLGHFEWASGPGAEGVAGVDVSDDASRVLMVDPETHQVVDIGSATPEIVSVMPGGGESQCGLVTQGPGGFTSFVGNRQQWRDGYHMIAATDADLVYFLAKPNGECGKPWGLYVRDRGAGTTTLIDPGVEGSDLEFIRATVDGDQGYFLTASQLDATDRNTGTDLYRWDQSSRESTCLTCVVPNAAIAPEAGGGGSSPVMISDDFSHAYFVSHRRLVANEGVEGGENIYVLSGGTVSFVGTASQHEVETEALQSGNAELSSDGTTLIFTSSSDILPSGDAGPRLTSDAIGCGKCQQIYRYEDGEKSLECVSCAPSGITMAPIGNGDVSVRKRGFAMSADGSTVGFVTAQALSDHDESGAADVYQWRDGALRLITDGVSKAQTGLAAPAVRGLDADGSNMLFSVLQPGLTGFERDEFSNLYDARIGGGFEPPAPPAHCEGDSCQGPLQASPPTSSPASSTFSGRGNRTGGKKKGACPKTRVRRHGRCVNRHSHRHRCRKRRCRKHHRRPSRARVRRSR